MKSVCEGREGQKQVIFFYTRAREYTQAQLQQKDS
jgi:hypothetical protein